MATQPFSSFGRAIDRRISQINRNVNKIVRDSTGAAGEAAVLATRVDTGKARSNWQASLNAPTFTVIPPYAAGNKLGFSERANALGAINQQRQVLSVFNPSSGKPAFIANNVEYIGILEHGGPFVGPGNMLAAARQAFIVKVKTAKVFKK